MIYLIIWLACGAVAAWATDRVGFRSDRRCIMVGRDAKWAAVMGAIVIVGLISLCVVLLGLKGEFGYPVSASGWDWLLGKAKQKE